MAGDSRDYICLSGAKELLDEVKLDISARYPWDTPYREQNKKIVEEYLEYRYAKAVSKINNG